jgi:hypothetical protein
VFWRASERFEVSVDPFFRSTSEIDPNTRTVHPPRSAGSHRAVRNRRA